MTMAVQSGVGREALYLAIAVFASSASMGTQRVLGTESKQLVQK